ncbi:MAG: hypothetical protein ACM3PU_18490 [Gemmatimonadota bacterium]
MRALLLFLLLLNLVVFAYQRGWLGEWSTAGREPSRIAQQIEPQAIRLLTDADLRRMREHGGGAGTGAAAPGDESAVACVEFGDFAAEVAPRVRQRLDAFELGTRLTTTDVSVPGWYMVYVPPLATRDEAERVADDLRSRGVRDLLVIDEPGPLRNGISLGQFKDQDLALKHQADLQRRGISGVRVSTRASGGATMTRFRIKPADPGVMQQLTALQKEFGATRFAPCAE